ncbi:MAG: hypothetical protein ACOZCO_05880 [Bacteroidota bacterium]
MNKTEKIEKMTGDDSSKSFFYLEISDLESLKLTLEAHEIEFDVVSENRVGERTHYICRVFCNDMKKAFWLGMAYNMNRSKKLN